VLPALVGARLITMPRSKRGVEVQRDIELAGYRLGTLIGRGGMGSVYRAEQVRLRREVALKIMAPDLAGDPVFRRRFLRESQIAAGLDHPSVVPIFDAGEVDGVLFLAMRYIAGSDLRARIRRERAMAPGVVLQVLEQIAGALDAAHALGLVHRDVKPSNILVADHQPGQGLVRAYLTDFGLSKLVVETTGGTMGRPLGSVHYMSPEQIRSEAVDARADVYSLGCMVYECLVGEVPFGGDSEVAVLYGHLESPPPAVSSRGLQLPGALDGVIASALAKSPDDRPASAGQLYAAVAGAFAGSSPPRGRERAAAVRPPPPAPAPGRRDRRPVVGRIEQLNELLTALEDALAGRGSIVLLTGETGIGKTTLARSLAEHAERRGLSAVWGTGWSAGDAAPPYWHWVQVVRSLAHRTDGPELLRGVGPAAGWLTAIAPDLAAELPDAPSAPASSGVEEGSFRIYDALVRLLERAARTSALVVVLDDLHFADEASLLALAFIAHVVRGTRVLIVGTYRGEELEHSLVRESVGWGNTISLEGLAADHVGTLIGARTGDVPPSALVERIHEVTSGNPLFVSELLNLLEAQGRLQDPFIASSALPLPTGIRDAIAQRLQPLPPLGREALSVGAVIGTSFRASTVAAAAGIAPRQLLPLLDQAAQLGLLRPQGELADGYTFSHGLVQATLYEALARGQRCTLHAAIGEALERSYDVVAGEGLAEIAHHFLEAAPAGDAARAVRYARLAAEQATRTFAYEQAVTLYTRALAYVDPAQAGDRIRLLQALGEAQMRTGDTQAARTTLQRAADVARAHDDPEGLARAALASSIWGLSLGIDEPLLRLAEEAAARLEDAGSPQLLASVKGLLATELYWSDAVARRHRLAGEALSLARTERERLQTTESLRTLAYVLGRYLLARWGPDSAEQDFALSDELLDHSYELRDGELEILIRNWRISVLLEMGQFAAVDQEIARVEQMATDLRQPRAMVFLPLFHGIRAGTAGRFAEAERLNMESVAIARRVRGTVAELAATAQLLTIRIQQGRLAELEDTVRTVANRNPGMVAVHCALALLLVQTGRRAEGLAALERLTGSGLAGLPRDNTHVVMLALLAEVAAELDERDSAKALYSWLEPYAGRWVVSPGASTLWPVDRSLGRLATVTGPEEIALRHIRDAREQAARAGAAPSLALAALDQARLVARRGRPRDRGEVRSLAREARELAQELEMGLVVDTATLLEATGDG